MFVTPTFTEYSFGQFAEIRNRKELCDFVLEVDGKLHFAHKVILAASMPYFEELFVGSGGDDNVNATALILPLGGVLEALLTFAYSGLKPEASTVTIKDYLSPMLDDVDAGTLLQQRFTKFDHFRRTEKLCDFTFIIKDAVFSAHKIILAASIPLFADLFLNPDQSNVLDYTILNRLSPKAVQTLLQFAYSGEFSPTLATQEEEGDGLWEIIIAAKLFQVQKVEELCLAFLSQRLNFDVVQQYWRFAHSHDIFELQEMLQSYVCANFQEFIGTPAFLALTATELEDMLVRDDLSVPSENDIFRAIVSWVDNKGAHRPSSMQKIAINGRVEAFPRLFTRLRVSKLSEDFREQILSHPLCRTHLDCAELELQTKLLRMTLMVKEQEVISRVAQSDRAYRQLPTDVLFIVKQDSLKATESALVEIFNPTEKTWQEFSYMPRPLDAQSLILNNHIYTLNNQSNKLSMDIFDVKTKQSKRGATADFPIEAYSAVAIHDHILVLVESDRYSGWWAYNTISNKWIEGPKQKPFRSESCLVTLQNRYVLAIGSLSAFPDYMKSVVYCEPGRAVINDSDAFFRIPSAAGSTWTKPAPSLPEALWQCRAAELDDRIFVVGECVSEFTTVRVAVFCPQMGVDKNNSLRLGGQWFLLSPESSPSWLSTNLVSHTGRLYLFGPQRYFEEFGTSLCFQPCSEEELEKMKQEKEAASEAVTNKTRESPVPEHSAASDNHDSAKRGKKYKPTTLPDSDPFSKWRWRPFCAPDKALDVCYAGVISVALPSGRQ